MHTCRLIRAFANPAIYAFVCTAVDTTTGGVYSHSPHNSVLPPSLTYSFNVSLRKIKEDIRYTYARIPKHSLSEKDLEHVKEQCNGPISLQLLVRLHSNQSDAPHSVFTLLSSARIQENSVGRSFPVEFSEITPQFRRWQKDGEDADRQGDIVEMRLIVGGSDSCYDAVTPQDLGFRPNTSAHLVIFSKSDDSEEAIIKAGLAELAAEATASRQRRNAERETVVNEEERPSEADLEEEVDEDNMTRLTNHELFNMSHYHLRSCRRYSHIVSQLHTQTHTHSRDTTNLQNNSLFEQYYTLPAVSMSGLLCTAWIPTKTAAWQIVFTRNRIPEALHAHHF